MIVPTTTAVAIAASPLVRAYQTAVDFLSILAPAMRPVTCDELAIDKLKPNHLSGFLTHLPAGGNRTPSREEKAVAAIGHRHEQLAARDQQAKGFAQHRARLMNVLQRVPHRDDVIALRRQFRV